jgi:KUP system potassium uptake protein
MDNTPLNSRSRLLGSAFSSLGIVFGDIGTSPLYAISFLFADLLADNSKNSLPADAVFGTISLIFWALTLIVGIKYLVFIVRADNDGEGGVFSLYALLHSQKRRGVNWLLFLLILAAGLLFGDGIVTPAISVLSAVEGLGVAAPMFNSYIVGVTVLILSILFLIQFVGSQKVGKVFGPIIFIWFMAIGVLGLAQIFQHPEIFYAINPMYALRYLFNGGLKGAEIALAGVILSITGGEALYADLGHFGRQPIRLSWFFIVYPALILNYFGQGAFLLSGQTVVNKNIFYSMVPNQALVPMILLATLATVIASQALISGVFSLASQGTALGLLPRIKIVHTHHEHEGQVYSPFVNACLFLGSFLLVINFRSSTALASTYGFAVSGDMLVSSIAMISVASLIWKWPRLKAFAIFGFFAAIDVLFFAANSSKLLEGAYIPLSVALCIFVIMLTWRWGRKATFHAYSNLKALTIRELLDLHAVHSHTLKRNVLMMVPREVRSLEEVSPAILQQFWERYRLIPQNLLLVHVAHRKVPFIHQERYQIHPLVRKPDHPSIIFVKVEFGFMEDPNVESILEGLAAHHKINLSQDPNEWIAHVSVENLLPSEEQNLIRKFRFRLFRILRHISQPAYYFYGLGRLIHLSVEILPVRLR